MNIRQLFLQNLAQSSEFPLALEFKYAEGCYLYDPQNRPYLDLISGIGVNNMGHRHPEVVNAIKNQSDQYLHQMVYGEFVQSPQVQLAKALIETLTSHKTSSHLSIDQVYFTNSGTEAVEGALKLAKRYTGKPEIVAIRNSYHGSTHGALALGEEHFKRNFRPLMPGIRKINRNLFTDLELITEKTAAVIIEPIGAESGIQVTDIDFMNALKMRCKEKGALLIFDEIQTGMGRTGQLWAWQHYGFLPDILLSAKGLGGGMPLGAFMAPQSIMSVLTDNPILGHITTFGGHPVSCAAALANLRAIQNEIDFEKVNQMGQKIKALFEKIPGVHEVRGQGMMMAAQMDDFETIQNKIQKLIENQVITDWFLYCDSAIRIAPPLIFNDNDLDFLEGALRK